MTTKKMQIWVKTGKPRKQKIHQRITTTTNSSMPGRIFILSVLIILFTAPSAFCQSEVLKSVVNNLAYYKQKKDLKYLAQAKKSVDSVITTRADSSNLEKMVYRALVNSSILYIDSLNKLNQPVTFFGKTVELVDRLS